MMRAGVAPEFHMGWRMPCGLSAQAPGPAEAVCSPTRTPISPVRTWTQTSLRWVCGGDQRGRRDDLLDHGYDAAGLLGAHPHDDIESAAGLVAPARAEEKGHRSSSNTKAGQARIEEAVIPAFTSFDGIVLHYEHAGSGEPVMLLPLGDDVLLNAIKQAIERSRIALPNEAELACASRFSRVTHAARTRNYGIGRFRPVEQTDRSQARYQRDHGEGPPRTGYAEDASQFPRRTGESRCSTRRATGRAPLIPRYRPTPSCNRSWPATRLSLIVSS